MPGHPSAYLNVSACYLWEDGDPLHLGGKKTQPAGELSVGMKFAPHKNRKNDMSSPERSNSLKKKSDVAMKTTPYSFSVVFFNPLEKY